eukprot:TRINITY_DN22732_c0_g1_i1.p1 TRINITY_DN22732_c0_g1~~TRINITY_DN22732_c0_g1_i1.p1  ORF type:complete len:1053 (+),score=179.66 TRINITY_DN22732_c0_g1_i1:334-3159(+)
MQDAWSSEASGAPTPRSSGRRASNGSESSERSYRQRRQRPSRRVSGTVINHKDEGAVKKRSLRRTAGEKRPEKGPKSVDPETRDFLAKVMRKHFLFGALQDSEWDNVFSHMTKVKTKANAVVFNQGDIGDSCYFIRTGHFQVSIDGKDLKKLGPSETFGELSLLYLTLRTATITCCSEGGGELWQMDQARFRSCMENVTSRQVAKALSFFRADANFNGLRAEEMELFAGTCSWQSFTDGEEILRRGEVGEWLFIIISGEAMVYGANGGCCLGAELTDDDDDIGVVKDPDRPRKHKVGSVLGSVGLIYGHRQVGGARSVGSTACLAVGKVALERLPRPISDVLRRCSLKAILTCLPRSPEVKDLWRLLSEEQKHRVLAVVEDCVFEPNEIIVAPADPGQLVIVIDGTAAVLKELPDFEQRNETVFCGKGTDIRAAAEDILSELMGYGEQPEASDGTPMSRYVVAITQVRMHRLTHERIQEALGEPLIEVARQNQIKVVLQDIFLFKNLREDQLDRLVRHLESHCFSAGEVIVSQDDPARHFFLIIRGTISVVKDGTVLRNLGRWDYFGERALLLREKRSATCQAVDDCVCLVLDCHVFFEVVGMFRKELERRMYLQDLNITMKDLKTKAVIGRGTFGVVRLVTHRSDEQKSYALKCVKKIQVIKNGQQKAIVMEREVNAQCFHPCIMQFIKTFQDSHHVYFLTEFLGGGDLFLAIRKIGALNKLQSQFFAGSISLGIEYLHARGIMYRDLKPENVLMDFQGCAKLVDFGCCKKEMRTSTLIGTPEYIAPEVILGMGYTCSVDWWSLGVMLHEFIVGPLPFGNDTDDQMKLFQAIVEAALVLPDYVSDPTARLILNSLLDRQPDRRLGSSSRGAKDIKEQPYYMGFNWDALAGGFFDPPWKPNALELMQSWESPDCENMSHISSSKTGRSKHNPPGMEWADGF